MDRDLKLNAIAAEQFSRPGRSSIGQSTLKRLCTDKITTMFRTIKKMINRVHMAHRDLDGTYSGEDIGDWENFPRGILQGNACGPTIWAILSSVIFDCFRRNGCSNSFCSALFK